MTDIQEQDVLDPANPAVVVVYEDYFGFGESKEFALPDGKQKIFYKVMNEGERKKFQQATNRDIRFNQATKDAHLKADPAAERHMLIATCVTGWSLKKRGPGNTWVDAPFSSGRPGAELERWLEVANPEIIDDLELAIRQSNPWMLAEQTVEEIDKEMERLAEARKAAQERERGKADSSSK